MSSQKSELQRCLKCSDIEVLRLDENKSIGYTFKCLGAGFWALKQTDFRTALTEIVMNVSFYNFHYSTTDPKATTLTRFTVYILKPVNRKTCALH